MMCVLTRLSDDLMIVGAETATYSNRGYPVDCAELEKIAPMFAAIQTIVNASNYNGFGVANVKLTPRHLTYNDINHKLALMRMIDVDSDKAVATQEILSLTAADAGSGENIRFFEVSCQYICRQFCKSMFICLIICNSQLVRYLCLPTMTTDWV